MMDGKSIRNKLIGSDDERAVSPVIGVILMVAITVILAAVIAAFVLDMGSGQQASVTASVQIDNGEVTLTDKGNADGVKFVNGGSTVMETAGGSTPATIENVGGDLNAVSDTELSDSDGTVNVVAYQGTDPTDPDNENVIQDFEV